MFAKLHFALLLAAAIFSSAYSKDDTLEEMAIGKEVTESVIRKILKAGILTNDNSFLTRVAYVESNFGSKNTTFRTDYYGGIWQVEESVFQETFSAHLFPLHTIIRSRFGITWAQVTWRDLLRPMHSGLAAALYFARTNAIEAIPQTIASQAAYWRKYYRPLGNATKFIEDAEELRDETRCRGKLILCVVLDKSTSIDANDYRKAKDFVGSMIESFTADFTRIGMLTFSTSTEVIFEIANNKTFAELAALARNAAGPAGNTRTDLALRLGVNLFKNAEEIIEEGVPTVMTVLTDGASNGPPGELEKAIELVKNASIKPISIGIGSGINQQELLQIALNDSRSVFTLDNFSGLQDFLQLLTSITCEIPQAPVPGGTYNDSLVQNEKRNYKISEPPAEGITVSLDVTEGKTNGYWSHTEEVPSASVHDGVIDGPTFIPAPPAQTRRTRQGDEGEGEGEEEEEVEPAIYFTIQGVEAKNNYTLSVKEGNHAPPPPPPDDSGASIAILTNSVAFLLIGLHIFFN